MTVIILLLAASISVSAIFLAGFLWCVRHRQYDDEYSPPVRILFEEELELRSPETSHPNPESFASNGK